MDENDNANVILMAGNRAVIKRKHFEQHIDVATAVKFCYRETAKFKS